MAGQCGGAREGGLTSIINALYLYECIIQTTSNHLRLKLFKNVKNSEEMLEFVLEHWSCSQKRFSGHKISAESQGHCQGNIIQKENILSTVKHLFSSFTIFIPCCTVDMCQCR